MQHSGGIRLGESDEKRHKGPPEPISGGGGLSREVALKIKMPMPRSTMKGHPQAGGIREEEGLLEKEKRTRHLLQGGVENLKGQSWL